MRKQLSTILLALLCGVQIVQAQYAQLDLKEVWFTPVAGSGSGGTGTPQDPFNVPNATAFYNWMDYLRIFGYADLTIHLMPGTFEVHDGGHGAPLAPLSGWKIRGAGMDVTILKLVDGHPAQGTPPSEAIIRTPLGTYTHNVEVSDLTLDCNFAGNPTLNVGGIFLLGSNNRVSRVRGINWGTGTTAENFVVSVVTDTETDQGGVIEDCIVEQPGQGSHSSGGTTAFAIGGGYNTQGGWVIRGCLVKNITAGAPNHPVKINGYTGAGRGCEIYNNTALNILGNAGFVDTWHATDHVWRNNTFLNVIHGIWYGLPGHNATNVAILNNLITVTNSNGAGIWFEGTYVSHRKRRIKIDGNIVYPHTPGGSFGSALKINGDVEFSADNNILDSGGALGMYDFFVGSSTYENLKPLSFVNNRNLRGKPLKLGEWHWMFSDRLNAYYEEELKFTPTAPGWYKVLLHNQYGAARLSISTKGNNYHPTDLGLAYWVEDVPPQFKGEITQLYNNSWEGVGEIPNVRLAKFDSLSGDDVPWGSWASAAFQIEVPSGLVNSEIRVRISGTMRPACFAQSSVGNFEPYIQPTTPSTIINLQMHRGVRTTGPIVGDAGIQLITGASLGYVLMSDALGNGQWQALPTSLPPSGPASGDLTGSYPNPTVANDAVSNAKLRNSSAVSVIGRSANSTGDPADITAAANGQFLRRAADTLGFGAIAASDLGSGTANNRTFLRGDQTWAAAPGGIRKTADSTLNGTAYQNVTGLSFDVVGGADYAFEFTVVLTTSGTGEGYALALSAPGSPAELTYEVEARTNATLRTVNYQFTGNDAMSATASGPGSTRTISRIRGVLRNGASPGTVTVRARAETAGGSVTVKGGSWGLWF